MRARLPLAALAIFLLVLRELSGQPPDSSPLPVLGPLVDAWRPPAAAMAVARTVGEGSTASARSRIEALSPAERVTMYRAGLRLPQGPAAVVCARELTYDQLDAWESRRQVQLLLRAASESGDWDELWGHFRFAMACDDLPALVEALAGSRGGLEGPSLPKVHVFVRAEHIPLLCRELLREEPRRRGVAVEALQVALLYSDRHREVVARTLWRLAGSPPYDRGERAGLPLGLRRVLRLLFLEEHPVLEELNPTVWCLRWLRGERAGVEDLPLLRELLGRDLDPFCHRQILRALGRARGPLPELPWGRLVPEDPTSVLFALAARARRGDDVAQARLVEEAAHSALAFALLLDALPAEALALGMGLIESGEFPALLDTLSDDETLEELLQGHGLHWDAEVLAPLVPAFLATEPGPLALSQAFTTLPGFGCRSVAAALLARLEEDSLRPALARMGEPPLMEVLDEKALACLEVLWPDELRERLRGLASSAHLPLREGGLALLYRLGDPGCDRAILAWALRERPGLWPDEELGPGSLARLGRSAGPVVRQGIERRELVAAWAVALGAPLSAATDLGACYRDADRESREAALGHLRAGRLGEAAAALLPARPAPGYPRSGASGTRGLRGGCGRSARIANARLTGGPPASSPSRAMAAPARRSGERSFAAST